MQMFLFFIISFESVIYGGERWNFSRSARISGLGEASVSLKDPAGIVFNPAISMLFEKKSLELTFSDYFENIFKFGSLNFITGDSLKKFFISLNYIFSDNILYTIYKDTIPAGDISEIENKGYISINSIQIVTGFSKKIKNFYAGISTKIFREDLYSGKGYGIGIDLGFLFKKNYIISLVLRNIGGSFNFWQSGRKEWVPPSMRVGGSKILLDKFLIAIDFETSFEKKIRLKPYAGLEFSHNKKLFIRAGWRENVPSFGVGFRLKKIHIDYALGGNFDLSVFHIFSVIFNF